MISNAPTKWFWDINPVLFMHLINKIFSPVNITVTLSQHRLLCSGLSMSLLPSQSQILISSYVLFIDFKETGTQSLYLPMSCLPAHQCGMASRIWGQLRNGGRPNCRRFAPLRLWDDLESQRVREVSSWDQSPPHLLQRRQEWWLSKSSTWLHRDWRNSRT